MRLFLFVSLIGVSLAQYNGASSNTKYGERPSQSTSYGQSVESTPYSGAQPAPSTRYGEQAPTTINPCPEGSRVMTRGPYNHPVRCLPHNTGVCVMAAMGGGADAPSNVCCWHNRVDYHCCVDVAASECPAYRNVTVVIHKSQAHLGRHGPTQYIFPVQDHGKYAQPMEPATIVSAVPYPQVDYTTTTPQPYPTPPVTVRPASYEVEYTTQRPYGQGVPVVGGYSNSPPSGDYNRPASQPNTYGGAAPATGDGYDTAVPSGPAYQEPAPAVPAYQKPVPAYEEPAAAPSYEQTASSYSQVQKPEPAYQQPAPVAYQASVPAQQPSPAYNDAEPAYQKPTPVAQPAPTYQEPAPATYQESAVAPALPGYQEPAPTSYQESAPAPQTDTYGSSVPAPQGDNYGPAAPATQPDTSYGADVSAPQQEAYGGSVPAPSTQPESYDSVPAPAPQESYNSAPAVPQPQGYNNDVPVPQTQTYNSVPQVTSPPFVYGAPNVPRPSPPAPPPTTTYVSQPQLPPGFIEPVGRPSVYSPGSSAPAYTQGYGQAQQPANNYNQAPAQQYNPAPAHQNTVYGGTNPSLPPLSAGTRPDMPPGLTGYNPSEYGRQPVIHHANRGVGGYARSKRDIVLRVRREN